MLLARVVTRGRRILNSTSNGIRSSRLEKPYRKELVTVIDQCFDQRKEIVAEKNDGFEVAKVGGFTCGL